MFFFSAKIFLNEIIGPFAQNKAQQRKNVLAWPAVTDGDNDDDGQPESEEEDGATEGHQLEAVRALCNRCDQIWRHFAIWVKIFSQIW
jgi:hypothetical protein